MLHPSIPSDRVGCKHGSDWQTRMTGGLQKDMIKVWSVIVRLVSKICFWPESVNENIDVRKLRSVKCLTIILGEHPNHRHHLKEDFGFGVDELAVAAVPSPSLQVQAIDIHSLCWGLGDVVLHPLGHLVAQHHTVQGPALVGSSDLLWMRKPIHKLKQWRLQGDSRSSERQNWHLATVFP